MGMLSELLNDAGEILGKFIPDPIFTDNDNDYPNDNEKMDNGVSEPGSDSKD